MGGGGRGLGEPFLSCFRNTDQRERKKEKYLAGATDIPAQQPMAGTGPPSLCTQNLAPGLATGRGL